MTDDLDFDDLPPIPEAEKGYQLYLDAVKLAKQLRAKDPEWMAYIFLCLASEYKKKELYYAIEFLDDLVMK